MSGDERLLLVREAIESADRCENYYADASAGGEPCDGLDGCTNCLDLAARAILDALDVTAKGPDQGETT